MGTSLTWAGAAKGRVLVVGNEGRFCFHAMAQRRMGSLQHLSSGMIALNRHLGNSL